MKKTLSIYLSILFLGLVGLSSCQENGQEEVPTQLSEILKGDDPVGYESKLKELSIIDEMRLLGNPNSDSYMNFNKCFLLDDNSNLIGDTFNDDGTVMTRTVGGEEYPVITQDVAQFILRIRQ
jgi:hypothetical protein